VTGRLVVLPLGVGDAFSARWYSSAFAVGAIEAGGDATWILIDCPHPIRKMLVEGCASTPFDLDLPNIEAVVLTHLHGDHASGLESYGFFSHFALQQRARILTHPAVEKRLWANHLAAGMDHLLDAAGGSREMSQNDYFDISPLRPGLTTTVGPFSIDCRMTIHHVPTTALRISAFGRVFAFSADTSFDAELLAWLFEDADVVFHETNLGAHTPYEKLAALPPALRARMRLYHFPDFFDVDGSAIECLVPGRVVEVKPQPALAFALG
jgi:ribonuclease BN (tRNA processing enzyme)